jgi:predicted oxidoreductase
VYQYLESPARHVASALLAIPGKHTQAVISYLADIRGDILRTAIQQLIVTNMVTMNTVDTDDATDMCYELGELSRSYLMKHHPVSPGESENFQTRKAQIAALQEKYMKDATGNRYLPHFVSTRSKEDILLRNI